MADLDPKLEAGFAALMEFARADADYPHTQKSALEAVIRAYLAAARPSTGEVAELVKRWAEDLPDDVLEDNLARLTSMEERGNYAYLIDTAVAKALIDGRREASDALTTVCAERDEARREKDAALAALQDRSPALAHQTRLQIAATSRAIAAEATAERMRVALEEIAKSELTYDNWVQVRARAALSQDKEGTRE